MDGREFHYLIGKTLMYCQTIENDVKWIYAGMLKGNDEETYKEIEDWTLGKVIVELEELDNSDGNPYLTAKDYKLLKSVTYERNYIVHQIYRNFLYEENQTIKMIKFNKEAEKLMDINLKFESLKNIVEQVRIDILKKYNRI